MMHDIYTIPRDIVLSLGTRLAVNSSSILLLFFIATIGGCVYLENL